MKAPILHLDHYGLTESNLKTINKPVQAVILFANPPIKALLALTPIARKKKVETFIANQADRVLKKYTFYDVSFPRTKEKSIVEVTGTAQDILALSKEAGVKAIAVQKIIGLNKVKAPSVSSKGWYVTTATFLFQVKGELLGKQYVQERTYILYAASEKEAVRRAKQEWKKEEEPYLGRDWEIIRQRLLEVVSVTCVFTEEEGFDKTQLHFVSAKSYQQKIEAGTVWK